MERPNCNGEKRAEAAAEMLFLSRMRLGKAPLPENVIIDPANICNLKCPLCPTGSGAINYKKCAMPLARFRRILAKFPRIRDLYLFNWGEPFLNRDLIPMIRHAAARGARVEVHSNFNFRADAGLFRRLALSGLDTLVLSIDGATQRSYSRYRKGGRLRTVFGNIKALADAKEKAGAARPRIIWKFLVNRHNEAEIRTAARAAKALKIDFATGDFNLGDDIPDCDFGPGIERRKAGWLPRNEKHVPQRYRGRYGLPLYDSPCFSLFKTICVNPDGKVFPCCFASDERNAFGDLTESSLEEIWYGEKYRRARGLFTGEKCAGPVTVCDGCRNFLKYGE